MEAPELERRLAAIVAADVEGYSRLMHRDEEATMVLLSARRANINDVILGHRGRIANTAGEPGGGPLISITLVAAVDRGRDFATWLAWCPANTAASRSGVADTCAPC